MRKILTFLLLIPVLLSPVAAQKSRKKNKKLVTPQDALRLIPKPATDSIESLLHDITIDSNGLAKSVRTFQVRINNPYHAMQPIRDYEFLNSDLEEIVVVEPFVLSKDGTRSTISADKITTHLSSQAASAPSFSSSKFIEVDIGQIEVGGGYGYTTINTEKKSVFEGKFSSLLVLSPFFDYKHFEVNLSAPADYPIRFVADRIAGGKISEEDGVARYRWVARDVKAAPLNSITNIVDLSPKLAITSFADHEELISMYEDEASKKSAVTPVVRELAEEITKGIEEPLEQASAIYSWVNKNIRYLSIVLDRSGWVPHSADEIIRNGYGDCKDYSTLLQALLNAKGIASSQVVVAADTNYWFPEIAIPEIFNHVILYIPSLDLYADGTAVNTRLGLISKVMRGKKSLRTGTDQPVITIEPETPEMNQFISDTAVKFNGLGDVEAVATNKYIGQPEMLFRPVLAELETLGSGTGRFVEGYLKYYGIEGTGRILNVSDSIREGKPFTVDLEVRMENVTTFTRNGSFYLPSMLNLHHLWDIETQVNPETRTTPFSIGAAKYLESFNVKLPDEVRITKLPTDSEFSNDLGDYLCSYKLENNILTIRRELVIKKGVIMPSEYPAFKEFMSKVSTTYYGNIIYRTNPRFVRNKMREKDQYITKSLGFLTSGADLNPSQVKLTEARVSRDPSDILSRKRLIRYYLTEATTPAEKTRLVNHQLWLIRNRPRESVNEVFGYYIYFSDDEKQQQLLFKRELAANIERFPNDPGILYNAILFSIGDDRPLALKLASTGRTKFPDRYEFAFVLFQEDYKKLLGETFAGPEEKNASTREIYNQAIETLELIKRERSSSRDSYRASLLPQIGELAYMVEEFGQAKEFARELILEFGNDSDSISYANAAHKGNILLGKIALRTDETDKAKEHLSIAINAPYLAGSYALLYPDLELAESLLVLGEVEAVLEYLKECEKFEFPDKVLLRRWQAQIRQGQMPSLTWDDAEQ